MEWDSLTQTVTSVLACLAAIAALLTVYFALVQHSERSQMLDSATSYRAIGPWRKEAYRRSILRMGIPTTHAPYIDLRALVADDWKPSIRYPDGKFVNISGSRLSPINIEIGSEALFPSWPKFLQALDIKPSDGSKKPYAMQPQAEILGGKLPMIWTGRELLALASALGFQAYVSAIREGRDDRSIYFESMPLPMHWHSPLGHLCFREHTDGCVVEFRPAANQIHQIGEDIHDFFKASGKYGTGIKLKGRLWNALSGWVLDNGKLLYLAGARRRGRANSKQQDTEESKASNPPVVRPGMHIIDRIMDSNSNDSVKDSDLSTAFNSELNSRLQGDFVPNGPLNRTDTSDSVGVLDCARYGVDPNAPSSIHGTSKPQWSKSYRRKKDGVPEFLRDLEEHFSKDDDDDDGKDPEKYQDFSRSDGILTASVEGELAGCRGIDLRKCEAYVRTYYSAEGFKKRPGPLHSFGYLHFTTEQLPAIRSAVLNLSPDGYYLDAQGAAHSQICMGLFDIDCQPRHRKS